VPGVRRDDWPLPDPAGQDLAAVRAIREVIAARMTALVRAEGLN
jgi:arsenate reductase